MRVGLIGTGAISNKHAQAYKNIGYEVTVCTDIYEPAGRAFAERWGCEFVPTYQELCKHPNIDYVDLCTFPDFRLDPIKECVAAGDFAGREGRPRLHSHYRNVDAIVIAYLLCGT